MIPYYDQICFVRSMINVIHLIYPSICWYGRNYDI